MTKAAAEPRPWRSGFCNTYPHATWQQEACLGGYARTPTKADPREWVPCACLCHQLQETPMPDPAHAVDLNKLTLTQAVDLFAAAAERLSEAATTSGLMGTDWQTALHLLDRLRAAGRTAGQVDATLVRHIYLTGEHGQIEVDGIGVVHIGRGRERKHWDERGVARAVIDAKMADSTGEPPDPWQVAEWLLEVYGVSYCRVTPLRALGLEPKAFCDDEPGNLQVSLPRRD